MSRRYLDLAGIDMGLLAEDLARAIERSRAILDPYPGGLDVQACDVRPALGSFLLAIMANGFARAGGRR